MSIDQLAELIGGVAIGHLATCVDGQPRVRPMSCVLMPDGRLWSSTYRTSGKVAEFEQNARVEICFLTLSKVHVRITGEVDISGGEDEKRQLLALNPKVRNHFSDEYDPKFVHLEIRPSRIRYKPTGFCEYTAIQL